MSNLLLWLILQELDVVEECGDCVDCESECREKKPKMSWKKSKVLSSKKSK